MDNECGEPTARNHVTSSQIKVYHGIPNNETQLGIVLLMFLPHSSNCLTTFDPHNLQIFCQNGDDI